MNTAVLASGSGTNLEAIIQAGISVSLVVVDRKCRAEDVATAAGIPLERLYRDEFGSSFDREVYAKELVIVLEKYAIDLVVMAGFLTIVGKALVDRYPHRILNQHPALLPAFGGTYGSGTIKATLESGVKETGTTVHVVTEDVKR